MIKNHIISERSDDGLSSYAFISISEIFKKIDFFWGGGEALRPPPPLKRRTRSRKVRMSWNFQHMLGLKWGVCDKIFSLILPRLPEIWLGQGQKLGRFISKISRSRVIGYVFFCFRWKEHVRIESTTEPFFLFSHFFVEKKYQSSMTLEKGVFNHGNPCTV